MLPNTGATASDCDVALLEGRVPQQVTVMLRQRVPQQVTVMLLCWKEGCRSK